MNAPPKVQHQLQAYRILLYRRALHPELFQVRNRLIIAHADYEVEGWVMPGAHALRFQFGAACGTELLTNQDSGLPERGVLAGFPCMGEREVEQEFEHGIKYVAAVQTETLSENLYNATYDELIAFAREADAAVTRWSEPDGARSASILDVQRFKKEIHAQSYHLIAQGGIVIRSQTIFEHA